MPYQIVKLNKSASKELSLFVSRILVCILGFNAVLREQFHNYVHFVFLHHLKGTVRVVNQMQKSLWNYVFKKKFSKIFVCF